LACLVVALVAVVASPTAASASPVRESVALDSGVLAGLNQIRVAHGLRPMRPNRELAAAAREHSLDMAQKHYFGHSSSDGTSFFKRIESFYVKSQYNHYGMVGENLIESTGPLTATAALDAWMASPLHRANILYPGWRDIGISAVTSGTTYITTDFGVRT
jgi:uncharacterized protein YkwD